MADTSAHQEPAATRPRSAGDPARRTARPTCSWSLTPPLFTHSSEKTLQGLPVYVSLFFLSPFLFSSSLLGDYFLPIVLFFSPLPFLFPCVSTTGRKVTAEPVSVHRRQPGAPARPAACGWESPPSAGLFSPALSHPGPGPDSRVLSHLPGRPFTAQTHPLVPCSPLGFFPVLTFL